MIGRHSLTPLAFSLSFFLFLLFAGSGSILSAAENTSLQTINNRMDSLSPEQIQQIIQNATPEQVERYRDSIGLVYRAALQEGIVLYERAPAA